MDPETAIISLLVTLNSPEFIQVQCLDADTGCELGWIKAVAASWAFLTSQDSPKCTFHMGQRPCLVPVPQHEVLTVVQWGQAPGRKVRWTFPSLPSATRDCRNCEEFSWEYPMEIQGVHLYTAPRLFHRCLSFDIIPSARFHFPHLADTQLILWSHLSNNDLQLRCLS